MWARSSNVLSSSIFPISLRSVVLSKLGDRKHVIPDAVGGALCVKHFEVQDAVHPHLHVVTRDADLFRDVQGRLFQRVAVADGIDKRDQNMGASSGKCF